MPHRPMDVHLAQRFARALVFVTGADELVGAALTEGVLPEPLEQLRVEVCDALPGIFVELVEDEIAAELVESLVQPVFDLLPTVSSFTDAELKEHGGALFSASLTDLGEHFCDHNERHLAAAIRAVLADAPAERVDAELGRLTSDLSVLLRTLRDTPCRMAAAEQLYEAAGVGWMLGVLARVADNPGTEDEVLAELACQWTDEEAES